MNDSGFDGKDVLKEILFMLLKNSYFLYMVVLYLGSDFHIAFECMESRLAANVNFSSCIDCDYDGSAYYCKIKKGVKM